MQKLGYCINYSGDIVDFKIRQLHWLRAFWPISQEKDFS